MKNIYHPGIAIIAAQFGIDVEIIRAVIAMRCPAAPYRVEIDCRDTKALKVIRLGGDPGKVSVEEIQTVSLLVRKRLVIPGHLSDLAAIELVLALFCTQTRIPVAESVGEYLIADRGRYPARHIQILFQNKGIIPGTEVTEDTFPGQITVAAVF